jgi:hypothetical protein
MTREKELKHIVEIDEARTLLIRPIRPEDEPLLVEMVMRSSPEDIRLRFLGARPRQASNSRRCPLPRNFVIPRQSGVRP